MANCATVQYLVRVSMCGGTASESEPAGERVTVNESRAYSSPTTINETTPLQAGIVVPCADSPCSTPILPAGA